MKTYKWFLGAAMPVLSECLLSEDVTPEDIRLIQDLTAFVCGQMTDYEITHNDTVAGALASTAGEIARLAIDIELCAEELAHAN